MSPNLPKNWEEALDNAGRTYYINHVTKTTQWENPSFIVVNPEFEKKDSSGYGSVVRCNDKKLFCIIPVSAKNWAVVYLALEVFGVVSFYY